MTAAKKKTRRAATKPAKKRGNPAKRPARKRAPRKKPPAPSASGRAASAGARPPPLTIDGLVAKAKKDPGSLTVAELRQLKQLQKMRGDSPDAASAYEAHRDAMAVRSRSMSKAGRDVGPLPEVVHPRRRAAALKNLRKFCKTYFPLRFNLEWSPDHIEFIDDAERAAVRGELFARAMPRGGGKTSIIEAAAIWVILKGIHQYIAVIGATQGKAAEILDSIKTEFAFNERLGEDFPEACHPIRALEGIHQRARGQLCDGEQTAMTWKADKLILPTIKANKASGAIIQTAGLTGAKIRGCKHTLTSGAVIRPSFIILDDPQTDESAQSNSQNATRLKLLAGAVLGMAGPAKKLSGFMLTTVISPGDMADEILDRKKHPRWHGKRYKMVYAFPKNDKLWAQYGEIWADCLRNEEPLGRATAFYEKHRAQMDDGAIVAWEARYEPGEISALQCAMNIKLDDEAAFFAEYQNEPVVDQAAAALLPAAEIAAKTNGYEPGVVPVACEILTAFVDVQEKLLYWAVAAWQPDTYTGAVIAYNSYPEQPEPYFTLRGARRTLKMAAKGAGLEGAIFAGLEKVVGNIMTRTFRRDDGTAMHVRRLLIDAAWGLSTETVREFCRQCPHDGVMPSFGRFIGAGRKPMSEYRRKRGDRLGYHWLIPALKNRAHGRHVLYDSNFWKSFLHSRIAVAKGDPGSLTFFGDKPAAHRMLADQLTAEAVVQTEGPYGVVDEWKLPPGQPDNHFLDALAGCACAASIEGVALPAAGKSRPYRRRKKIKLSDLQRGRP